MLTSNSEGTFYHIATEQNIKSYSKADLFCMYPNKEFLSLNKSALLINSLGYSNP